MRFVSALELEGVRARLAELGIPVPPGVNRELEWTVAKRRTLRHAVAHDYVWRDRTTPVCDRAAGRVVLFFPGPPARGAVLTPTELLELVRRCRQPESPTGELPWIPSAGTLRAAGAGPPSAAAIPVIPELLEVHPWLIL